MLLKYNIKDIKHERRLLNVISCEVSDIDENGYYFLTLQTKTPHKLNVGDIIVFNRDIVTLKNYSDAKSKISTLEKEVIYLIENEDIEEFDLNNNPIKRTYYYGYYKIEDGNIISVSNNDIDSLFVKYNSLNDNLKVELYNFTENTFSISCKKYQTITVNEVIDGDSNGMFRIEGVIPSLLNINDKITFIKNVYSYVYERDEEWDENIEEIEFNPSGYTNFLGFETVKFLGSVYKWKPTPTNIECEYVSENYFKYSYDNAIVLVNDTFEVEDNRFINNGNLHNDISFYEFTEYLNFSLPISSSNATELNDEDISNTYFNEKKEELITDIVDYEKKCFTPYYNDSDTFKLINSIKFNLFFRDRDDSDEWNTDDAMGWNQYKMNNKGVFQSKSELTGVTNGDLLTFLNFTDEDIYYRKKKVSKSFLRLSFYSSNNPFNQMLLFYSTIFFDSGDLYTKYMKNIDTKIIYPDIQLVKSNKLGENNLTASFAVYDRYNRDKSSEGYYLYLFPDGISNGKERIIYMKAEFNHAGYGKTVPLFIPNDGKKMLSFSDKGFPTSLLDNNGELTEFYNQLYMPITVKYNQLVKDYTYSFKYGNYDNETNCLTLNLFEPKINPLT